MSFQRFGRRRPTRRRGLGSIIDSNKNMPNAFTGGAAGGAGSVLIARAVDNPTTAVAVDVKRGSVIKAIWLEFWASPTAETAVGTTTALDLYIFKNPGANLTPPSPATQGTSNEKKFIFKTWKGLLGARTQGFPAYSWKGWIKVPKRYQRMGTDDTWSLEFLFTGVAGVLCHQEIYKWYS